MCVCVIVCVFVNGMGGGVGETHKIIYAQMCSVTLTGRPNIKVSVKVLVFNNDKPNAPITSILNIINIVHDLELNIP